MTKLARQLRLPPLPDPQVNVALRTMYEEIAREINGLLSFGTSDGGPQNIAGAWFSGVTPGAANTDFTVTHNLGRIPQGWIPISIDQAGVVYKGVGAWTKTQIFLRCNVTSANVKLFVV